MRLQSFTAHLNSFTWKFNSLKRTIMHQTACQLNFCMHTHDCKLAGAIQRVRFSIFGRRSLRWQSLVENRLGLLLFGFNTLQYAEPHFQLVHQWLNLHQLINAEMADAMKI
jgi:hypothetical protein